MKQVVYNTMLLYASNQDNAAVTICWGSHCIRIKTSEFVWTPYHIFAFQIRNSI